MQLGMQERKRRRLSSCFCWAISFFGSYMMMTSMLSCTCALVSGRFCYLEVAGEVSSHEFSLVLGIGQITGVPYSCYFSFFSSFVLSCRISHLFVLASVSFSLYLSVNVVLAYGAKYYSEPIVFSPCCTCIYCCLCQSCTLQVLPQLLKRMCILFFTSNNVKFDQVFQKIYQ